MATRASFGKLSFTIPTIIESPSLLPEPEPGGPRPRFGVEGGWEGEEPTLKPPSQDPTTSLNRGKDILQKSSQGLSEGDSQRRDGVIGIGERLPGLQCRRVERDHGQG